MKKIQPLFFALCLAPYALCPVYAFGAGKQRSIDYWGTPIWDEHMHHAERADFRDIDRSGAGSSDWDFWSRGNVYYGPQPDPTAKYYDDFGNLDFELGFQPLKPGHQSSWAREIIYLPERRVNIPILTDRDTETEHAIQELLAISDHDGERTGREEIWVGEAPWSPTNWCPFETEKECEIWASKPHVIETVAPRPRKIKHDNIYPLASLMNAGYEITTEAPDFAPLLRRYHSMMASSRACCTDGMVHRLRRDGASDGLIYKFVVDDANFDRFGERCLVTTDEYFAEHHPDSEAAKMAAQTRDVCICKGREWFDALLAPFNQLYESAPDFEHQPLLYTYKDGLGRETTVSINQDVQAVKRIMASCLP